MNRYYTVGFDDKKNAGWPDAETTISKTEKKIIKMLLRRLPGHICLINSTWLGDDLQGLKKFIDKTPCTEAAVYSGPDWENTNCIERRREAHQYIEDHFSKVYHLGNTNKGYYFNYWLEFIRDYWKHFDKKKYQTSPKLARKADGTVGQNGKHFLCYNRKPHDHRVSLLNKIHNQGLENFGIISAIQTHKGYNFKNPIILDETHDKETLKIINEWENQNENDIVSLGDAENWSRHFLTVVTESSIHTDVFLSEKTFKPIIGLRPFLILGDQNLYKKLKEMGFDIFEDMFPDILISLSNPEYEKRIDYIVNQLEKLTSLSHQELDDKYQELLPRLWANRVRLNEVIIENRERIDNAGEVFKSKEQNSIQVPWDHYFTMETFAKDYPPQPKRPHWRDGQWEIGMPANVTGGKSESQIVPPFVVDRSFHNPNDIFYLWYDQLEPGPISGRPIVADIPQLPGNCYKDGLNVAVSQRSSMQWWYEYAGLNHKLMDINKFNENVHGRNHPLHNYYFIEIAYLDGMSQIIAEIPPRVKELARKRMLQIVFVFPHEGFHLDTHWWMEKLNGSMTAEDLNGIYSYFIYGDINFEKNYDHWLDNNPMGEQSKFTKAIGYDYFQFLYRQQYVLRTDPLEVGLFTLDHARKFIHPNNVFERETIHSVPTAEDKTHDLLNFNGLPRQHRMAIVSELNRLGYDESNSYISFLLRFYGEDTGAAQYKKHWKRTLEQIENDLLETKAQVYHLNEYFKNPHQLELDMSSEELQKDDRYYDKKLYETSYFSLVNETIFYEDDSNQLMNMFITEKTYKPLMNYHPFMVVGLPYTLRYLRQQGFQTFPEMFDEFYDTFKEPKHRFKYIIQNLENWKGLSKDDKDEKYNAVRHKLAFNRFHFLHHTKHQQLKDRKRDLLLSLHPYKNND